MIRDWTKPDLPYENSEEFARKMDREDPLRSCRNLFHIPQKIGGDDCVYFCGNSLGLQPKTAKKLIEDEIEDWARLGVDGHLDARNPWLPYHELLTEQMADLVGAKPEEVVVMNSLTVNLHLMMVSFYRPIGNRNKILIEANAFPSDQYAVKSQLKFHGFHPNESLVEVQPAQHTEIVLTEHIEEALEEEGDSIALIMLGGVNYYSGQVFDMKKIVDLGHKKGCVVGFDLAHAVGNIPLQLHNWEVDFAAWCSYKYLNAGPGSVGGVYINRRYAKSKSLPRFEGWWGHDKETRFEMPPEFDPIYGAEGWQLSNAPVFSMASLRASMEIFHQVGMENLRDKSEKLTGYLLFLLEMIPGSRIEVITPRNMDNRGCQLSIRIDGTGKELFEQLNEKGFIVDWREPDIIRVAPVPLYNTFTDVFMFANALEELLPEV